MAKQPIRVARSSSCGSIAVLTDARHPARRRSATAMFEKELMRWAMVPSVEFRDVPMPAGAEYAPGPAVDRAARHRRQSRAVDAAGLPPGARRRAPRSSSSTRPASSNPPPGTRRSTIAESQDRAALFVRSQASAFNSVGAIWAPKYRQATFGAFLTSEDNARRALDFAYRDVLAAYEEFLREAPADRPIILAAHSQGSLHLMRLLQERMRGAPEARRIVAAYVIGWPVSETADLPALPFPACERPDQARCLLSWQSFSEPADPSQVTDVYDATTGPGGVAAGGIGDALHQSADRRARRRRRGAERNLGTLVPNEALSDAEFRRGAVPARCDPRGFLLIGDNEALPDDGPLCAARQQLPRLRLRPVLGEHPRRRRAAAGGVRGRRDDHRRPPPEFRDALPEGGRLLGLDVGTKTIGTALCDAGWTIATAGRADPPHQVRQGSRAR